jgi:hypothetical protein
MIIIKQSKRLVVENINIPPKVFQDLRVFCDIRIERVSFGLNDSYRGHILVLYRVYEVLFNLLRPPQIFHKTNKFQLVNKKSVLNSLSGTSNEF